MDKRQLKFQQELARLSSSPRNQGRQFSDARVIEINIPLPQLNLRQGFSNLEGDLKRAFDGVAQMRFPWSPRPPAEPDFYDLMLLPRPVPERKPLIDLSGVAATASVLGARATALAQDFAGSATNIRMPAVFNRYRTQTFATASAFMLVFLLSANPFGRATDVAPEGPVIAAAAGIEKKASFKLAKPFPGFHIHNHVGTRFHPILKEDKPHTGGDAPAPYGTPIKSVGEGIVVHAGKIKKYPGYGDCVIVKHTVGQGVFYSFHAHLSKVLVRVGAHVSDQDIATIGDSGLATAPHDHFELCPEKDGKLYRIDPKEAFEAGDLLKPGVLEKLEKSAKRRLGGSIVPGWMQVIPVEYRSKQASSVAAGMGPYELTISG